MNCYLLVGGQSRRLGRSKVELFAPRVTEAALEAFENVVLVDRAFEGPHEGEGVVFGVLASLRDASSSCFVLAVDYPLVTSEVLRFLRERFERGSASMLVPMWRGEPQTLCAGYSAALAPVIERRIAEGRLDLRGLIAEAGAEIIPETELRARFAGEPLLNVNTPEELQEAERLHGKS